MPDSVPTTTVNTTSPPRQNSTLTALGLIVITGVVLFVLVLRKNEVPPIDAALSHPAVGMPLPDFSVDILTGDGKPFQSSELHGKVTLISFWGPWCPPCVQEFPHLTKLAENLRDRAEFRWLPVAYSNDPRAPADDLRQSASAFLSRNGFQTITYYDPQESLLQAAAAVGAFQNSFPCTVLLDPGGRIHAVWNGYSPGVEEQVEAAAMGLLK
jgi:cytochrome c biogenesis protein CcmG/thiol:disulfide interchange protein DsbE